MKIQEKGDDSHGSEIERFKKKQKRFYTGRIDSGTGYPWYTDRVAGAFIDRYIKKADQKVVLAEARNAQMALQTVLSEDYDSTRNAGGNPTQGQINDAAKLAEVEASSISDVSFNEDSKVTAMTYTGDKYKAVYAKNATSDKYEWTVSNK